MKSWEDAVVTKESPRRRAEGIFMPISLPAAAAFSQTPCAQGASNLMWIESHPELENHPKFLKLCTLLKRDKLSVIGLLHKFWWWCTAYAEDGDLRKYGIQGINAALNLDLKDSSLLKAGFIDRYPFLRVHDWWVYYGRFLKIKYRHNSEKLIQIENLCFQVKHTRNRHVKDMSNKRNAQDTDVTDVPDVRDLTNGRTDVPAETAFLSKDGGEKKKATTHPPTCTCEICWSRRARGS